MAFKVFARKYGRGNHNIKMIPIISLHSYGLNFNLAAKEKWLGDSMGVEIFLDKENPNEIKMAFRPLVEVNSNCYRISRTGARKSTHQVSCGLAIKESRLIEKGKLLYFTAKEVGGGIFELVPIEEQRQ